MPKDDRSSARAYREWLRRLPSETGKSYSAIAKEAGIAVSTLTRPIRPDDPGTSGPHQRTIDKVVARFRIAPPAFEAAPAPPAAPAPEVIAYRPAGPSVAAIRVLSGGRNSVEPFVVMTRALELAGIMPRDLVLVDRNATPIAGQAVLATIKHLDGGKAGLVIREYQLAGAIGLLVSRSIERLAPIIVDGERVSVAGVLLPHRLAAA